MGRTIRLALAVLVTPLVIVFFSSDVKAQFSTAQELEWVRAHSTPPLEYHGPGRQACDAQWAGLHKSTSEYAEFLRHCIYNVSQGSGTPLAQQMQRQHAQEPNLDTLAGIEAYANKLFPMASQGQERVRWITDQWNRSQDRLRGVGTSRIEVYGPR